MSAEKRAWVFANGELRSHERVRSWIETGDLLVAVDGGSRHLASLGLTPDLLVGDLDSIDPDLSSRYQRQGVKILRFPAEKNETDLELAVGAVVQQGSLGVRILGAMGGRLDHLLGNVGLLLNPAWKDLDLRLVDEGIEVLAIFREAEIQGKAGDLLSLVPFSGEAQGVWTEGLYYPLRQETLYPYQPRGISNVFLGEQARIGLSSGQLICIHMEV